MITENSLPALPKTKHLLGSATRMDKQWGVVQSRRANTCPGHGLAISKLCISAGLAEATHGTASVFCISNISVLWII